MCKDTDTPFLTCRLTCVKIDHNFDRVNFSLKDIVDGALNGKGNGKMNDDYYSSEQIDELYKKGECAY